MHAISDWLYSYIRMITRNYDGLADTVIGFTDNDTLDCHEFFLGRVSRSWIDRFVSFRFVSCNKWCGLQIIIKQVWIKLMCLLGISCTLLFENSNFGWCSAQSGVLLNLGDVLLKVVFCSESGVLMSIRPFSLLSCRIASPSLSRVSLSCLTVDGLLYMCLQVSSHTLNRAIRHNYAGPCDTNIWIVCWALSAFTRASDKPFWSLKVHKI